MSINVINIENITFQLTKGEKIMLSDRHKSILKILEEKNHASVSELAKSLFVSEMTIRRDLKSLEKDGFLQCYHGGAMRVQDNSLTPISERKLFSSDEKNELAKRTEKFIHDNMSVFIDCSSTCMYIIPIIAKYKNVRIVTNSIQNLLLASHYHIPCFISGGNYFERDMCTTGSITNQILSEINVDVAFCTALGLSEDGIISDELEELASARKIIIKNAKKIVFLFSKDKTNKKFFHTICHQSDVDHIIR